MSSSTDAAARALEGSDLVTLEAIREAADRLRAVVLRTPLLPFGESTPPVTWLKPESLQTIGAFKIRGAYNAIALLSEDRRARGVIAHSSGNHAQGVARAARLLGTRAVIVMPSDASPVKVAGVRADGAEVVFVGRSSEERAALAAELAVRDGLALVPPYEDPGVIAGQGTVGLEIVEQLHDVGEDPGKVVVLVPIGGGGLAAGVATAVKLLGSGATVLGVEPELAADARDSLRAGRVVRWAPEEVGRTIADGLRTAAVGHLPFAHLRRHLDGIVVVSEDEIRRAMARAARVARLVLEPSGATALAARLFRVSELPAAQSVVCVLSGGNVDADRYARLVAEGIEAGG